MFPLNHMGIAHVKNIGDLVSLSNTQIQIQNLNNNDKSVQCSGQYRGLW